MSVFDVQQLAAWSGATWRPGRPARVTGVSKDTRTLQAGDLYIALKGDVFDGHDFVADAAGKGAAAALVSQDWYDKQGNKGEVSVLPSLCAADTTAALAALARGYRTDVDPLIVGITGSAGKTTVKEMTSQILAVGHAVACTKGNWNNAIGLPMSLLEMGAGTQIGVFEIGTNHPGEIAPLADMLMPDWAVVTNVGPAHIEHFGSLEAIAIEKGALPQRVSVDGATVLLRDDPHFALLRALAASRVISVSVVGDADYEGSMTAPDRVVIRERASGDAAEIFLPIPGVHNVLNLLQSAAVARGLGASWDQIDAAMSGFAALPYRWERKSVGGLSIINDAYNANPLSMRAALKTFQDEASTAQRWVVLGDMLELGKEAEGEHAALGALLATQNWDGVIVVGTYGDTVVRAAVDGGMPAERICACEHSDAAAAILRDGTQAGDAVLLKGSRGVHLEKIVELLADEARTLAT